MVIVNGGQESGNQKQSPTVVFLRRLERSAQEIRNKAGVNPLDRLDPLELEKQLRIKVVPLDKLQGLTSEHIDFLCRLSPKDWSGAGLSQKLEDGTMLVPVHPRQTIQRMRVTVLEEVAHDFYGHQPVQLNGNGRKSYDEVAEQEAYWTAAAVLLPMKAVARAVWLGQSAETLGNEFGASEQLAEMRIKIMGLWDEYVVRSHGS